MRFMLQDWLYRRGLNVSQVAEGLGVAVSSVNVWIKGRMRDGQRVEVWPSAEMLEALCVFLECQPGDLLVVESTATSTGKTWRDFGPAQGRGRPRKATPEEQAGALEYVEEATQAYADAVARGDKQTDLRPRQRALTEAWVGAADAGAEVPPGQVPES